MQENEKGPPPPETSGSVSENEIKFEKAKAERAKAELKLEKKKSRESAKKGVERTAKKLGAKNIGIIAITIAIVVFALTAFVIPLTTSNNETRCLSESDLKSVVDIDNLSTIDYVYHGVAEKHDQFLWQDNVSYRVKYEAHVRASYNLGDIEFRIDENGKTVTAYLPEATIADPQIDYNKFDFLPSNATADMDEVMRICREDAAAEVSHEEIQREANASLQKIVSALVTPLIENEYTLSFGTIADLAEPETPANTADPSAAAEETETNE